MTVYICYDCVCNGCDMWKHVEFICHTEATAKKWVDDIKHTEYKWREYESFEVRA